MVVDVINNAFVFRFRERIVSWFGFYRPYSWLVFLRYALSRSSCRRLFPLLYPKGMCPRKGSGAFGERGISPTYPDEETAMF